MQGFFNTWKSNNVVHHINKLKQKITYDHCNRCKKCFWQNSTSIYNRNSPGSGLRGIYLNILKAIYDKPTANIILNGENMKAFPLRSGPRQTCPLSPLLFNIILEVLAMAIRDKKEMKEIQTGKEVKLSPFCRWHDTIHRKP